ncbi:MAG TPA: tetratricopeptide repeat protein [Longimicrobiales bacterium]|nr:tetratricopeptide repeat protein [Longimicrobiales bacterium]
MNRTAGVRLPLVLGLLLAASAGAALVQPIQAQTGSDRFRVLVAPLDGTDAAKKKFGEKVANEVRKRIDDMATHVAVPPKEIRDAFKKFGVKEAEAGCIQYRQLQPQLQPPAQLTMCGSIDAAGQVTTTFFSEGGTYVVPPFAATSEAAVATQITQGFGDYTKQLSMVVYCTDYLNSSQWQEALDRCNQALELNGNSEAALYGRASALLNMERNEEALQSFQKVLEVNPINQEAMLAAGIVAAKIGQTEQSQKYLHEYLELNPGDVQVRLKIATDLANAGDPAGALRLVEEAAAADPANMALAEYSGHFAMNAASKLIAESPAADKVPDAAQEYLLKAVASFRKVEEAHGDTASTVVLRQMMTAYKNLGQKDQALAYGARVTARPDADANAWSSYADALREANKTREALAALDKAKQLDPSTPVLARKALMQIDAGQLQGAVATIAEARRANELDERNADALAQKLIVTGYQQFGKAKRYDQAITYYDAGREIAQTNYTKGMANFFHGYAIYDQAVAAQQAGSVASARRSLPMFQRARTLLEGAGGYTEQAKARGDLLNAIQRYVEIQEALIKRG